MRRLSLRHAVVGVAAVVAALAVGASVASAAQGATLSLQVVPSSLISGGPGWVFATFTNTGTTPLNDVVVNIDLGGATLDSSGTVLPCTGSGSSVSCPLGTVPAGAPPISLTIAFTAPVVQGSVSLSISGTATWDALTNGNSGNASTHTSAQPATANVFYVTGLNGVSGGCLSSSGSVTSGNINVQVDGNTSGLPCAPIVTGTTATSTNCQLLFEKLTSGQTAQVTLTFPEDCLPWPNNNDGTYSGPKKAENAGQPLRENPDFPNDLGREWSVPWCDANGVPSVDPSTGLPYSTDACIVSITPTDTGEHPYDADAGTILLNVVGGPGDASFYR